MSSTPPTLAASRIVGSTNASLDDAVSNLSRLLYTNDSPSSQHAVFVSEWTRLLDDSIVQLDAAIADASAVPSLISSTTPCASINEQKTQRANLRRLRDQVQSVNSTVRQVPPEIWQQIFLFVHQSSDNGMSVFDRRDPVYRIGQVCQKWRRISHHCPRLWSRLYVDGTQVSNLSRGVSHLRTVLERSCRAPLDFIFGYEGSSRDEEREVPARLLSLLMQYSSRWRSAEFTGLTFLEALLLRSVRGQIPHLQSVGLALYVEDIGSERADMVTAFEVAPELSQVNLKGIPLSQVLLDPCAKQNLCSLRVNHSAAADLMFSCRTPTLSDVLRTYPKLTNISHRRSFLDAVTWPTPPPLDTPRTVYTNITSLSVADGDSINVISLPNLTDLDAGFGGRDFVEGLFPCVVSLLQHSRCRLSSLRLQYAEWDKDSMGVLLSLVPDLETLSISSGGLPETEGMMLVLTRLLGEKSEEDGQRPKYVPRLKMLYICLSGTVIAFFPRWSFTRSVFLDMVAMREQHGALEVVELYGNYKRGVVFPHLRSDDLKRWKDMCERGLIDSHVSVFKF